MKWGMTRVILLVSSHDLVASDVCPGGGIQMSSLPALPLITQNTLPGEGWVLASGRQGTRSHSTTLGGLVYTRSRNCQLGVQLPR
jgi:hypothetical protein